MRYDVNWQLIRIWMLICGTSVGILALILGFLLIRSGASGEFSILGEGKGLKIFLTSVSPGIFLSLIGCVVAAIAFWLQKACLGMPTAKQIEARGGIKYYELENQLTEMKLKYSKNNLLSEGVKNESRNINLDQKVAEQGYGEGH